MVGLELQKKTFDFNFQSRFCSNLGLPAVVQRAATCIAKQAVDQDLVSGRSPISVAAAAIYMASQASKEKKSQKGKSKTFLLIKLQDFCC